MSILIIKTLYVLLLNTLASYYIKKGLLKANKTEVVCISCSRIYLTTEKKALGYLPPHAIRFVKHKREIRIYPHLLLKGFSLIK